MADSVWSSLLAGVRPRNGRAASPPVHAPVAAVLTCSDARVVPEAVFGRSPGSLFAVRVAGNSATPAAVASLDVAVDELGVDLVVVLGHTSCAAVTAAVDGRCTDELAPVLASIRADLDAQDAAVDVDRAVELHVESTVRQISEHAGATGRAIRAGRASIRGAVYDLRSGLVHGIRPPTPTPHPLETP